MAIMIRTKCCALEGMCWIANGDVVSLGLMTEKEFATPQGKLRAQSIIPLSMRGEFMKEVARYGWAKRATVVEVSSPDGSMTPGAVSIYLPHNGREDLPDAPGTAL